MQALSFEQLERKAPSIFATEPWEEMSDKYLFVPTINVVQGLMDQGFQPVHANQTNVRNLDKVQYARHVVRFRHNDFAKPENVGDEIPELVLLNSHDGTSSYRLMLGIFRLVCSNGMIVSSGQIDEIRIRHKGRDELLNDVIDASYEIVGNAPKAFKQIDQWKNIELSPSEQEAYAAAAFELRGSTMEAEPQELLRLRRYADKGHDLWKTMNCVQENLIRGGYRARNSKNERKRVRGVKSVDGDTKLNRALWVLTEKLAEVKQAA